MKFLGFLEKAISDFGKDGFAVSSSVSLYFDIQQHVRPMSRCDKYKILVHQPHIVVRLLFACCSFVFNDPPTSKVN